MTVVTRPDLSARTMLSKSAVVGWDMCATKAGYELTERRPLILTEKISFGSALDAATEVLIVGRREGWTEKRVLAGAEDAIAQITERDGIPLPESELGVAVRGFWNDVMPTRDWSDVATQPEVTAHIAGLGDVQGHPDVVLVGEPWDVKSSRYKKDLPSVELGLYAILLEEAYGTEVRQAGYFTWVRGYAKPRWEIQPWEITSEARRWTWARVRQYAQARDAGAFYGAPKYPQLCDGCQYNPAAGGPCQIAWNGEGNE